MDHMFVFDDSRTWWFAIEPYFWKLFYEGNYTFIGEKTYAASDTTMETLRERLGDLITHEGKMYSSTKVEQFFIRGATPTTKPIDGKEPVPEYLGLLKMKGGKLEVFVAAPNRAVSDGVIAMLDELWPPSVITQEDVVPFWFWTATANGPTNYKRKLSVCTWEEIEANYPSKNADPLSALMERRPPFIGGRLILWHGPAGTGKTYSIRALVHKWKTWCKAQYIMDADRFFGSAEYMMQVMMGRNDSGYDPDEDIMDEGVDRKAVALANKDKWNLIIVEDAQEFLTADAQSRKGQDVGRLLNITDGLIGQGLKVLVLITTNIDVKDMHPAVSRAGRCMSNIEFHGFSKAAATEWLAAHDITDDAEVTQFFERRMRKGLTSHEITLAELYEELGDVENRQILSEKKAAHSTGQYL